jgi:quercetin dioxygenase-like cupin family protein
MVVQDHPLKVRVDQPIEGGPDTRPEHGWVDMTVKWLITRASVGSDATVFGITEFPPGSRHEVHRHPRAEETEYLLEGEGVARVGVDEVALQAGEIVFVPRNAYHGFRNTSATQRAVMVWCYAGAASLEEAGYFLERDDLRDVGSIEDQATKV